MAVYMLEFSEPLGNPNKPNASAKFYLGWCEDRRLGARLREHFKGRGASITKAAKERGISMRVVMVIEKATPALEQRLKRWQKNALIVQKWHEGKLKIFPHELGNYPVI